MPIAVHEKPEAPPEKDKCQVTLLDPARLGIRCCDSKTLIIHAPVRTRVELLCGDDFNDLGYPRLTLGTYEGKEVIFFDDGSRANELPLRLGPGEFVPLTLGLVRLQRKRGSGVLKATQRRGDGELSPGYTIEG